MERKEEFKFILIHKLIHKCIYKFSCNSKERGPVSSGSICNKQVKSVLYAALNPPFTIIQHHTKILLYLNIIGFEFLNFYEARKKINLSKLLDVYSLWDFIRFVCLVGDQCFYRLSCCRNNFANTENETEG